MKPLGRLFVTALTVGTLFLPATAKQSLPVTVSCTNSGATSATVSVKLKAPAKAVTITVGGTGSVVMDLVIRRSESASQSQQITVPVTFTAGSTTGGLVVEVRGDFGQGMQSQIRTFSLVEGPRESTGEVRARTDGGGSASPDIVVVPARTSTERR